MNPNAAPARPDRFNLSRWFALTALLSITVLAVGLGTLLDRFVTQRMLQQEAVLTQEFVQSLVQVEKSLQRYFADPSRGLDDEIEGSFKHIAALPDMLRANVYDTQRRIIWSSDRQLIGRSFGPNDELDEALAGQVVAHSADPAGADKAEHQDLKHPQPMFVEIYVPVRDAQGGRVQAVIEFYKNPKALVAALQQLRLYIALGAAASGALLFGALF